MKTLWSPVCSRDLSRFAFLSSYDDDVNASQHMTERRRLRCASIRHQ